MTPLRAIAICRKYGSLLRFDLGIISAAFEFVKLYLLYFAPHSQTASFCVFQDFASFYSKYAKVPKAAALSSFDGSRLSLAPIAQIYSNLCIFGIDRFAI
jgi:hypothetical protein